MTTERRRVAFFRLWFGRIPAVAVRMLVPVLVGVGLSGFAGPVATIGVDELEPGMTGWGLSMFNPTGSIDTFGVELVDVMRNVTPGGDMILCRLSGQNLEHSGIVAGMSGSPVYFDGRLAGAVAYGWGFAKDPLAGITPVAEMLEILKLPQTWTSVPETGMKGELKRQTRDAWSGLPRLPVPFSITGSAAGLLALAGTMLDGFGLMPVATGMSRADVQTGPAGSADAFRPGSAVGVVLADGDVRFAATGTVTWVEGDRLLAFGHPMFQAGSVALPMSADRVHAVMSSYLSSFKLSSSGPPVGTIVQDRLPAVSGIIGPVPAMIPVRVVLETPVLKRDYSFRIAEFEPLIPVIAALGLAEVVYATEAMEEMTLEARVRVKVGGHDPVAFRHVFADRAPADLLAQALWNRLRMLLDNRFEPVRLESLDVELTFRPGRHRLTITGVQPARTTVAPGDTLPLRLELRDATGKTSARTVPVAIPPAIPAGRLMLSVSSSDTFLLREGFRAPGSVEPRSIAELLRLLERTGNEDVLVIAGYAGAPGLTSGGRELPAVPPTLRRLLGSGRSSGRTQPVGDSRFFVQRLKLEGIIAGNYEVQLEVKR